MSASTIRRLRPSRRANEAVDETLSEAERTVMIGAAATKLAELFDILHVDHRNGQNTRDTPRRVARTFVDEIMHGRFSGPPALTEFENAEKFDQLIVMGPIDIRSTCSHHPMPIYGDCFIGVLPSATGKIIGLSKYDRIVNYFAGRLQTQGTGPPDRAILLRTRRSRLVSPCGSAPCTCARRIVAYGRTSGAAG